MFEQAFKNKISSGYNLREIIDHIRSQVEKHESSHLDAVFEATARRKIDALEALKKSLLRRAFTEAI